MKKIISILIVTVMLAAAFSVCAFAADSVNVTVTISDGNGNIAVCLEEMTVTDTDGDGKFTVYDVLATADPDGFEAEETQWGLSIKKLCGVENGGSYGYYVNHQMAMGLTDEVKDGDYVAAFVYVDAEGLSDVYAYIEEAADVTTPDLPNYISFRAQYVGWDENWNPVVIPISGADVYVDDEQAVFEGSEEGTKTNSDGSFTIDFKSNGEHTITVRSADRNYACAVYKTTRDFFETKVVDTTASDEPVTDAPAETNAPAETDAPATGVKTAPQTGDLTVAVLALLAVSGAAIFIAKRREEK